MLFHLKFHIEVWTTGSNIKEHHVGQTLNDKELGRLGTQQLLHLEETSLDQKLSLKVGTVGLILEAWIWNDNVSKGGTWG